MWSLIINKNSCLPIYIYISFDVQSPTSDMITQGVPPMPAEKDAEYIWKHHTINHSVISKTLNLQTNNFKVVILLHRNEEPDVNVNSLLIQ